MWRLMCRANWQSQRVRYFLRPTKLRWSRRISGKAPRHRVGLPALANTIDGPERSTPLHLGPTKTSAKDLARSRSVRIGVFRFEKKKRLVANLSAQRQLSVAKLSAKRIFSLAKRYFLVANGRMTADFSSPVTRYWRKDNLEEVCQFSSPRHSPFES